ncbi:MAG: hypothetical protein IT449_12860 [Phycisphaerales bacterium]|nr:hypothetical protein [Phycisphaerales bacterium]
MDAVVTENQTNFPCLNDCGQIAYTERFGGGASTQEILLYDNGLLVRVTTNNDRDVAASMNNHGQMVWLRGQGSGDAHQVVLYENGIERMIQDDDRLVSPASISNLGTAVWSRNQSEECPLRSEVFVFDGNSIQSIYNSELMLQGADINDAGWITWMSSDFCVGPWVGTIQLACGGPVVDLPSSYPQVQGPKLNRRGLVVWDAQSNLEVWENGATELILDTVDAAVPNIGDGGEIYFARFDRPRRRWNAWLYRPEPGGPRFYRLTQDDYDASRGSVNSWGEAAWVSWRDPNHGDWSGGIRLLRRIRTGDSEFDGDVDAADYSRLHGCLTGPITTTGLCECRFLDIDYDGDLDLADFARFQNAFGASY